MTAIDTASSSFRDLQAELLSDLGPKGVVDDAAALASFLEDRRGRLQGATPFMVRPASTEEVAAVVRRCAARRIAIVPQGGNTGLVGGSVPIAEQPAILMNLGRMKRVRDIDPVDYSMTAEAGCVLQDLQEAAAGVGRLLPLSLGAEGSCQLGGNISSNAGGIHVVRYGNTRDLVLGLEVVLPDGKIWDGLRALRKDNRGYDLKQLFIAAEGTLGVVTAAVLKLFPRPNDRATALVALSDPDKALALLAHCRAASADTVSSFELMPRIGVEFAVRHAEGARDPLSKAYPWYVLIELTGGDTAGAMQSMLESVLAEAQEAGELQDAVIAASESQTAALWRLRSGLVEAQKPEGGSIKHDVSVPVAAVPAFIRRASAAVAEALPGVRPVPFGHLGDGNIHFNLSQPVEMERAAFLARWESLNRLVHDIVADFGGSISAEHGIGRMKVGENARFKSPVELATMRKLKAALDPQGIMNPGVML